MGEASSKSLVYGDDSFKMGDCKSLKDVMMSLFNLLSALVLLGDCLPLQCVLS